MNATFSSLIRSSCLTAIFLLGMLPVGAQSTGDKVPPPPGSGNSDNRRPTSQGSQGSGNYQNLPTSSVPSGSQVDRNLTPNVSTTIQNFEKKAAGKAAPLISNPRPVPPQPNVARKMEVFEPNGPARSNGGGASSSSTAPAGGKGTASGQYGRVNMSAKPPTGAAPVYSMPTSGFSNASSNASSSSSGYSQPPNPPQFSAPGSAAPGTPATTQSAPGSKLPQAPGQTAGAKSAPGQSVPGKPAAKTSQPAKAKPGSAPASRNRPTPATSNATRGRSASQPAGRTPATRPKKQKSPKKLPLPRKK